MAEESGAQEEEKTLDIDPNLAALIAYLFGWVTGLIIFLLEGKNKFVRFHALQSIFLSIAVAIVFTALSIVTGILAIVPGLGIVFAFLGPLIMSVLGLGIFILWILLMVRAYQGDKLVLPIIGDLAEKNA